MGLQLAGALAGAAGGALGNAMSGGGGKSSLTDQYNAILNKALNNAISMNTNYTNQATGQINQSLGTATNQLNQSEQQALQSLFGLTNQAFNTGQSLLGPYRNSGYNAQDALNASMGLPVSSTPSAVSATNAANQQQYNALLQQTYGNTNAPSAPGAAPTLGAPNPSSVTEQQIKDYINQNSTEYTGRGPSKGALIYNGGIEFLGNLVKSQGPAIADILAPQNAQAAYQQQLSAYQDQTNKYNQVQQFLQQTGYDPNYTYTPPTTSNTPVANGTTTGATQQPAGGLSGFLNSPQYQALFGSGAASQMSADGTYNPVTAFQQDPGTQWAIDQGIKQLQQQGAAKGILQSGPMQEHILDYVTGLENQKYQQYQGQVGGAFTGYQNMLAGLAGLGSGVTGANTAASLFGQQAQLANSDIYGTGSQIAGFNMSAGQDIASLLANLGSSNASAILNTGAAKANQLNVAAGMNAQANNNQMASNATSAGSNAMNNAYGNALGYTPGNTASYLSNGGGGFQLPNGYVGNGSNPFGKTGNF